VSDYPTAVIFRREKTFAEAQEEMIDGKLSEHFDRWKILGETMMDVIPGVQQTIFLEGICYLILDQAWSVSLSDRFSMPHVVYTLSQELKRPESPLSPEQDFRTI